MDLQISRKGKKSLVHNVIWALYIPATKALYVEKAWYPGFIAKIEIDFIISDTEWGWGEYENIRFLHYGEMDIDKVLACFKLTE